MKAVCFKNGGGLEAIAIEERADPLPGAGEVRVRVRFAALNPADVLQRDGHYPAPPGSPADIPGLEVAGTVDACGDRVFDWKVGDRVFGLVGGGGLADAVIAHSRCVVAIPTGLEERAAACIPEVYVTAHDALVTQARLRSGSSVVVHGAAGGVGSAAVQIAAALGADVYGVIRNSRASDSIRSWGGTPVHERDFVASVFRGTNGAGADMIVETVGAVHFPANLDAIAICGRILLIGARIGDESTLDLSKLIKKRIRIYGTTLRPRPLEEKATAVQAFGHEVVPLLAAGVARPVIDSIFPVDQVLQAFDRLEKPGKIGKVLIQF